MKKIKFLSVLLVLALVSLFFYYRHENSKNVLVSPKKGDIIEAVYGLGKVKSERKYEIKISVVSTLEKLFVTEGEEVKNNAELLKFTDSAIFRAPFDGTVTIIPYNLMEAVTPQTVVLRIEDLKNKYIEVSLEQQAALRTKKGMRAAIVFESMRNDVFSGEVVSIFPRNDEFLAKIKIPHLEDNILPGMTADVSIEIERKHHVLMIPTSSLINGKVKRVRAGKTEKVDLKIGAIEGPWAEVVSGDLNDQDQLIVVR